MQTRRDFIKSIGALFAAVPLVGISASDPRIFWADKPINISADLNRELVLELGRQKPYYDFYISKEAYEDIKNWSVGHIDEQTRKEIYVSDGPSHLFGINISNYS